VARDAIARLDDVNKESAQRDYEKHLVRFAAMPGKSLDLEKIHAALQATRLAGKPPNRTGARLVYLEIVVRGTVEVKDQETVLNVSGTKQRFLLKGDPDGKLLEAPADGESKLHENTQAWLAARRKLSDAQKEAFQRLELALTKGVKAVRVTGRVHGWSGHFPAVLRELSGEPDKDQDKAAKRKPPLLIVTAFELAHE
jgi:hypothetical protein